MHKFMIVNVTKRQLLNPEKLNSGVRLCDFYLNKSYISKALEYLLLNNWQGDEVYIIRDGEIPLDSSTVYYDTLRNMHERFKSCKEPIKVNESIYEYCKVHYTDVSYRMVKLVRTKSSKLYYIVNTLTKEYVDMSKYPVEQVCISPTDLQPHYQFISPLILLLTMGNVSKAEGGYSGVNAGLVGSWCDSTKYIKLLESIQDGYIAFTPYFTTREQPIIRGETYQLEKAIIRHKAETMINKMQSVLAATHPDLTFYVVEYEWLKAKQCFKALVSLPEVIGRPEIKVYFKFSDDKDHLEIDYTNTKRGFKHVNKKRECKKIGDHNTLLSR